MKHKHFSVNNVPRLLQSTVQVSSFGKIQRRYSLSENARSVTHSKIKYRKQVAINAQERVQVPIPAPPMLVMTKQQPPRKTRPPVPSSELVYHPYVSRGPTNPAALPKAKICPV
jgi:hypothetical protein